MKVSDEVLSKRVLESNSICCNCTLGEDSCARNREHIAWIIDCKDIQIVALGVINVSSW